LHAPSFAQLPLQGVISIFGAAFEHPYRFWT
jgi:hypothetical protein